ncbi:hypothetical protein M406DRAFT_99040 [Cryphonectria parasitica EP155]|uniref:Uncharacterized protein n=1 Tax=Cryphonectria parasitica (strain ATCC 38755 / EP155) TaxID=660469 RepID=A0A9P4XX79_CRYP1|nr:uncharacterized protein M406DRAFT_99040 [Cryphonectria parasitica EP155]KAF3762430.1 hypothetical protein M406DRAFT_99040 [Cryphonectria parasitica EP155]
MLGLSLVTTIAEDPAGLTDEQVGLESPIHPLGIKPSGNKLLAPGTTDAREAIGTFQALPDEVLAQFLEYLDKKSLRQLGCCSKFLYAFSISEELWKTLFLASHEHNQRPFEWKGTWRSTLLGLPSDKQAKVDCSTVFSDVLHRPFVCSQISLNRFYSKIPRSNEMKRFKDLTYDEFAEKWSDTPFILTDCVRSWPVCQQWNMQCLLRTCADVKFRAEAVDWPFSTYYDYMTNSQDESPLYLFDKAFAEKMKITVGKHEGAAYWKPDCFGPDLFELLGSERPAHRWLIIGPAKSGSTFHKDPNATSAWNAVIQGAKYWIMFPPNVDVPGVYVSRDQSEVTSPLSIAEWLLEFHEEARQLPECVEGICRAGEILHVPSGWWHLVVNLESGIALTQNFVPKSHLVDALEFLKDKPDQVTGFKRDVLDPYGLFVERLKIEFPELLHEALLGLEKRQSRRKRKWDDAIAGDAEQEAGSGGGFSFGFGLDEDEDEVP